MGQTLGILEASMLIYVGPSNENLTQRETPLWTGKENSLHLINGKHFGIATAAGYWVTDTQHSVFHFSVTTSKHPHTHACAHTRTGSTGKSASSIQYLCVVVRSGPWDEEPPPPPSSLPSALSFLCLFVLVFVQTFLLIKIL